MFFIIFCSVTKTTKRFTSRILQKKYYWYSTYYTTDDYKFKNFCKCIWRTLCTSSKNKHWYLISDLEVNILLRILVLIEWNAVYTTWHTNVKMAHKCKGKVTYYSKYDWTFHVLCVCVLFGIDLSQKCIYICHCSCQHLHMRVHTLVHLWTCR